MSSTTARLGGSPRHKLPRRASLRILCGTQGVKLETFILLEHYGRNRQTVVCSLSLYVAIYARYAPRQRLLCFRLLREPRVTSSFAGEITINGL